VRKERDLRIAILFLFRPLEIDEYGDFLRADFRSYFVAGLPAINRGIHFPAICELECAANIESGIAGEQHQRVIFQRVGERCGCPVVPRGARCPWDFSRTRLPLS